MEIKHIESRCKELTQNLKSLADEKELSELMTIIHRPGWTTPAEALLVNGYLDSMSAHAKHIANLKQTLLEGARAVGGK
jgi:hypothetical protein